MATSPRFNVNTAIVSTNTNMTVISANVGNTSVIVVGSVDANGDITGINSLTIDYTAFYVRMATAFETVAINSTIMANNSNNILSHIINVDSSLASIASNNNMLRANTEIIANAANTLRVLANTTGIRMVSPFEEFNGVAMYQYMVEQGKALNTDQTQIVDEDTQNRAKTAIINYRSKLRDFSEF